MLKALFKEVHVQSCLQGERYKVYLLLTNIFDQHKIVCSTMGRDFLYNFIQAIDGEQDPRNLLVIFQLATDIIKSGFNLANLAEDLFEVTSCYFPIDFNPSASNKKATITNKDLVLGLRAVLSSTRVFAKFCIPLMLEKLDSDVQGAKIDSLQTLTACLPEYAKADMEPFVSTIWKAVKREVVHSVSEEAEKCGLQLLTQLVKSVSEWPIDEHDGRVDLYLFLSEIIDDCLSHIKEPIQDKLKWMSVQMILACARASSDACSEVVKSVVPLILQQAFESGKEPSGVTPVRMDNAFDMLVQILIICKPFIFYEHPLLPFKAELLELIKSMLVHKKSKNLQCSAVTASAALFAQKILSNDEVESMAMLLLDILLDEHHDVSLRNDVKATVGYLATMQSHIVRRCMLPKVVEELKSIDVSCKQSQRLKVLLECATALSGHFEIFQDVIKPLMTKVSECSLDEDHCIFLKEIMLGLKAITDCYLSDHMYTEYMALNVCLPLLKLCVQGALSPSAPGQCCASCEDSSSGYSQDCITLPLMQSAGTIMRNVCQKLRPGNTANFVSSLISDLYVNNDLLAFDIKTKPTFPFLPLDASLYPLQTRTVCFLTASLCAFDRAVTIPNVDQLQHKLMSLAMHSPDLPTYVAAAKTFAGFINKQDQISTELLEKTLDNVSKAFDKKQKAGAPSNKTQSMTLLIWTTKALAQRNHVRTMDFVDLIMTQFGDAEIGEMASAGFSILMRESEEVLNSASHAITKMMYKQRFFLLVLPKIVNAFETMKLDNNAPQEEENQNKKANYLTALAEMLVLIPKQVLLAQFSSLMPLLLQSLHSKVPSLLLSALSALLNLIQDAPDLMNSYADTLLDNFLSLLEFKGNMSVRLKAVTCIGALTLLPSPTLIPMKNRVIKSLCHTLDDRKRSV
uniref:MMS19 nucleotide excision repair protein n=1 Tax=Phallusia mammillata TaxID=59560 RepID=A0A6F9DKB7_9ASCI|nr:MMS19 nucleotide excision repair protein homolog [Phallusia mammillata]